MVLRSVYVSFLVFFFSSRRRHTRCLSDWSSDVCSSDLLTPWTRLAAFLSLILLCSFSSNAQTPSPAASGLTRQDNAGFYPGWMLGTRFEGRDRKSVV